jgi:cation diffusion facilitator CzcD-associated flavoprotein CzcO
MSAIDTLSQTAPNESMAELERQIERELEVLAYPEKPWMIPTFRPDGTPVLDVAIVGGGHCGIAAAFALMREQITNLLVIDENPYGEEGPWMTYARMATLRTRKTITGMELGFASLTFRSYYEAREGLEAYANLEKIPRRDWQDYMLWMRTVLNIPVQNSSRMTLLEHDGTEFRLTVEREGKTEIFYARRVVMATGPYSMGGPNIPEQVAENLPKSVYAHVSEMIDFAPFKGKRLAVIGAGASAFDNAGTALEAGAASVDLIMRRPLIPRLVMIKWTDWAGFVHTLPDLPDEDKWQIMVEVQRNDSPPPLTALNRVDQCPNFHIHFASPLVSTRMEGAEIVIETAKGSHRVDYVILGTGYTFNISGCAQLGEIGAKIALWSDRYTPDDADARERFRTSPYLGRHFEFTEKAAGEAPYLQYLFNFNQSATLSMGPTGRVTGLKYGVRRLVAGVTGSFFREDAKKHLATAKTYNESEIEGHRWVEVNPRNEV